MDLRYFSDERFLNLVPESVRALQRIVEIQITNYPIFIVEDEGFQYGDLAFIQSVLKGLTPIGDEDHIHVNVYAVREDFAPDIPGTDYMGMLLHWHITDDSLAPPRLKALNAELRKIVHDA
jgi:hypothetical protein